MIGFSTSSRLLLPVALALAVGSGIGVSSSAAEDVGAGSFTQLGQTVEAQVWEDKGLLVVTGFDPGKELRVTWEPKNASYLCAKRIVISPSGSGTLVEYWDRYTDDQPNVDETAKQVRDETVKAVSVFESLAK